jgi:DNA-binding CsgD family transcriptional regulator
MHPALKHLTPADALDLMSSPLDLQGFCDDHGLRLREVSSELWELAVACVDAPSPSDWRRRDADRLREFVRRAVGLPYRQRQIANLLLDHGVSLTECARELGISRETVRTHLRRLRATERMCRARQALYGETDDD